MGKIADLVNAATSYFASREEEKVYTTLDLKSVPMHDTRGGGAYGSYVPIYSSMQAWDAATDRLYGWNGTNINYAAEIGDLKLSVLLMACIRWAGINLASGRLQVVELDSDEKEDPILEHPFTALLKSPNPEASFKTMMKQFACSRVLAGECYYLIGRDNASRIKELWYEPHTTIRPKWDVNKFPEDKTANEFIQYFDIYRNGQWLPIPKRNVFRVYDLLDPITRRGTNGVDGLMRTIFTDQEREQYTALLLKNFGVTPKGVAPKASGLTIDAPALANTLQRRFSGSDRGKPTVFDEPMEVLDFSTDFSADAMEKIAHIAESRVAAAVGISAQSLRFMVSMQSSSYNNIREFRREDYEQWIMPTHDDFAEAAERQILRDMDTNESHVLRYDYSRVPIVQRDKMETAKETEILVRSRVIDQAEARERHAYDFDDPKYKDVWFPVQAATLTLSPIGGEPKPEEDDEPVKAARDKIPPKTLDESASFWREHTALDEPARDLIDATEYTNGKTN